MIALLTGKFSGIAPDDCSTHLGLWSFMCLPIGPGMYAPACKLRWHSLHPSVIQSACVGYLASYELHHDGVLGEPPLQQTPSKLDAQPVASCRTEINEIHQGCRGAASAGRSKGYCGLEPTGSQGPLTAWTVRLMLQQNMRFQGTFKAPAQRMPKYGRVSCCTRSVEVCRLLASDMHCGSCTTASQSASVADRGSVAHVAAICSSSDKFMIIITTGI